MEPIWLFASSNLLSRRLTIAPVLDFAACQGTLDFALTKIGTRGGLSWSAMTSPLDVDLFSGQALESGIRMKAVEHREIDRIIKGGYV